MIPAERLGAGRTAEVFAWEEGRILKLYRAEYPTDLAETEARMSGLVHAAGAPSPAVYGTQTLDGRRGIIFEHVDAPLMAHVFQDRRWCWLGWPTSLPSCTPRSTPAMRRNYPPSASV